MNIDGRRSIHLEPRAPRPKHASRASRRARWPAPKKEPKGASDGAETLRQGARKPPTVWSGRRGNQNLMPQRATTAAVVRTQQVRDLAFPPAIKKAISGTRPETPKRVTLPQGIIMPSSSSESPNSSKKDGSCPSANSVTGSGSAAQVCFFDAAREAAQGASRNAFTY